MSALDEKPDYEAMTTRYPHLGTAISPAIAAYCILWMSGCSYDAPHLSLSAWLDRAPLNTDTTLAGVEGHGLARAYLCLTLLLNTFVFATIVYGIAKHEADLSIFPYVYFALLIGTLLLSVLLNPVIHAGAIIVIIGLEVYLLVRFCLVSLKRAFLISVVFHLYQVAYVLAYRVIAGQYR